MRVIFDVWIRDKFEGKYKPEEEILFESVFNYIYDRVHHIIDEIDEEEEHEEPGKSKAIIVYLMEKPAKIVPARYSEKLTDRILGCFNENDAKLMWGSVANEIRKLWN